MIEEYGYLPVGRITITQNACIAYGKNIAWGRWRFNHKKRERELIGEKRDNWEDVAFYIWQKVQLLQHFRPDCVHAGEQRIVRGTKAPRAIEAHKIWRSICSSGFRDPQDDDEYDRHDILAALKKLLGMCKVFEPAIDMDEAGII